MICGFVAGIITTAIGQWFPSALTVGAGPMFLAGILVAIALTGAWAQLRPGLWRYLAAFFLCLIAYISALFVFSIVTGYSPEILGIAASHDITEFGSDVFLGLLAGMVVAAIFIELLVFVLTTLWSHQKLFLLGTMGFFSVFVAFIGRGILLRMDRLATPTYRYWAFFGLLFIVSEVLFAGAIGSQIWGKRQTRAEMDATDSV